jgi:hypothetical protein
LPNFTQGPGQPSGKQLGDRFAAKLVPLARQLIAQHIHTCIQKLTFPNIYWQPHGYQATTPFQCVKPRGLLVHPRDGGIVKVRAMLQGAPSPAQRNIHDVLKPTGRQHVPKTHN